MACKDWKLDERWSGFPGHERQSKPEHGTEAYGSLQWKGTDACIDVYCSCGEQYHLDADFIYYAQCPYCEKVFLANPHIELVPLTAKVLRESHCIQKGEDGQPDLPRGRHVVVRTDPIEPAE